MLEIIFDVTQIILNIITIVLVIRLMKGDKEE